MNFLNFSEQCSETAISLTQNKINDYLKKDVVTEVSGIEYKYLSKIIVLEKDQNRLILNLKKLYSFATKYHFKIYT